MLTITPIGSCRIATPLRLARDEYGFRINMSRIYGYSHSCAEAVQQMKFLHDAFTPAKDLWSLISRRDSTDDRFAQPHQASDVYIVELSSAKIISAGNQIVQLNYLKSKFADFFACAERSRQFVNLAKVGKQHALAQWLSGCWSASPAQRAETEILRTIEIETTTMERLCADMIALKSGLGEVLFVTHVNALNAQGQTMPGRGEFIAQVRDAGRALGFPVFDPTAAMNELGQSAALDDHSVAMAHFTSEFGKIVLDHWYDAAIYDVIERLVLDMPADAITRVIVPHVRAILATKNERRIADVSLLLDAVESEFPSNQALKVLRFQWALVGASENDVKRCFIQTAVENDLGQVPDLEHHLSRFGCLEDWFWELSGAPILQSGSQQWLTSFAKSRGWGDLAAEFDFWIPPKTGEELFSPGHQGAVGQAQISGEVSYEPAT